MISCSFIIEFDGILGVRPRCFFVYMCIVILYQLINKHPYWEFRYTIKISHHYILSLLFSIPKTNLYNCCHFLLKFEYSCRLPIFPFVIGRIESIVVSNNKNYWSNEQMYSGRKCFDKYWFAFWCVVLEGRKKKSNRPNGKRNFRLRFVRNSDDVTQFKWFLDGIALVPPLICWRQL